MHKQNRGCHRKGLFCCLGTVGLNLGQAVGFGGVGTDMLIVWRKDNVHENNRILNLVARSEGGDDEEVRICPLSHRC